MFGQDPFGAILDSTLAGETLDGKPVVLRRISKPQDAMECRILFISSTEEKHLKEILAALDRDGVLTVSDMPGFTRRGGMIQFVLDGDKVRFEVNLASAENSKLVLSSELLKVAASVRNGRFGRLIEMLKFQDSSIIRRLTWMNMLVSGTALLLACTAFIGYDKLTFRDAMVRNLSTQAQIIGSNSVSALQFNDPQSGDNTLSALKAAHNVLSAGIYTPMVGFSRPIRVNVGGHLPAVSPCRRVNRKSTGSAMTKSYSSALLCFRESQPRSCISGPVRRT